MTFNSPDAPKTRRELREAEARQLSSRASSVRPPAVPIAPRAVASAGPVVRVVRRPAPPKKRVASQLLSAAALLFAGALLVGTTVPANAFMSDAAELDTVSPKSAVVEGQSVEVSEIAVAADATRANYTVTSYAELLRQKYGSISYSYTVGIGPVMWPFPYPVPISNGYGELAAPCRWCSSFHKGIDFTPGAGVPIYAIAAGTVTYTEVSNSGFGNHVMIEHQINGKTVVSMYAHMQMNSSPLQVGQVVEAGDMVGLVGSTGVATGAHLHFEVTVNGSSTDPFTWLKANAAK